MQIKSGWISRLNRRTRVMLFVVVLISVVGGVFGVGRWIASNQSNPWAAYKSALLSRTHGDYVNAHTLWEAHPVPHYRLTIDRIAPYYNQEDAPRCEQGLEVKDEMVITTYKDTCTPMGAFKPMVPEWTVPDPPFEATVTQFFATIDRDTRRIYWTAQGVGCSMVWLEADYDSQTGYPTRLFYDLQFPRGMGGFPIPPQYLEPDDPTPHPKQRGCLTIGAVPGPTTTISLTPLP